MEEIKYITVDDLTDDYIEEMETNSGSGYGAESGCLRRKGTGNCIHRWIYLYAESN